MPSVGISSQISNLLKNYWKQIKKQNPYLLVTGLVLGCLTARYTSIILSRKIKKYTITGPVGLPFIGSALPFLKWPYQTLNEIGSYGKVTTVQLGFNTNVFINDIALAKKIMSNKTINLYRPPLANPPHFAHFLALNGPKWQKRRQYFSSNFIAKISNSKYIYNNITNTMNADIFPNIDNTIKNHEFWYPKTDYSFIDCNLMLNGIFGMNISLNNDKTGYVSKILPIPEQWFISITRVLILAACVKVNIGSFLYSIFTRNHNKLEQDAGNIIVAFMQNYGGFEFDLTNNSLSRKTNESSYIDFLINETDLNLSEIMSDVVLALIAGTNTPSKALEYGTILLAKNPAIQEEIYNELCDGKDINKANILRAFSHEVLRNAVIQPLGIPHYASKDVVIDNYFIPKGAVVHNNMYFMHKKGSNDDSIHLEYWLDGNKKFKMNNDVFMCFGSGKRSCAGRYAAMQLLYYVFAILVMRYKFVATTDDEVKQVFATVPALETEIGIKVEKRQEKVKNV